MSKRKIDGIVVSEGLDLFTIPPKDESEASARFMRIYPKNPVAEENPLEFEILSEDFVDLASSRLHLHVRIVQEDGTDLALEVKAEDGTFVEKGDYVAPVNDLFDAMFQYCKMSIGDNEMEELYNLYAYTAYMNLLTSSTKAEQDTVLRTQFWNKDDPKNMNFTWKGDKQTDAQGDVFGKEQFDKGRWYFMREMNAKHQTDGTWMSGRPACDLFHQKRYIPENSRITLRLIQQINPAFWYLARLDRKYKVIIDKAFMDVRVVKSSPGIATYYEKKLDDNPAYYAISRKIAIPFSARSGELSMVIQDPTRGRFPYKVYIGFVDEVAFNGNREKNPWYFENIDMSSLQLLVNGQSFRSAFDSKQVSLNYSALFEHGNNPNITPQEFESGTTLYAFYPKNTSEPIISQAQLIITFRTALTKNYKIIFYYECEESVYINP